jgi:galactose-1-phosphate uridylyltransferase
MLIEKRLSTLKVQIEGAVYSAEDSMTDLICYSFQIHVDKTPTRNNQYYLYFEIEPHLAIYNHTECIIVTVAIVAQYYMQNKVKLEHRRNNMPEWQY